MSLSDLIDLALEASDHSDDYSSEGSVYRSPSVRELLRQEDLSLEQQEQRPVDLPRYLYHGSAFRQQELKPGFAHTKELVRWDNSEDNTWLYASDDKDAATMLGISSAIEKKFKLDRYQCDDKAKKIVIDVSEPLTVADIHKLHVVVYSIKAEADDGWMANHNPANGINGEYKTQRTIDKNIIRCEDVRIADALRGWRVTINVTEPTMESLSTIVATVKKAFGMKTPEQKRKYAHNQVIQADIDRGREAIEQYLKMYFGNPAWLAKQEFNEEVSSAGLSPTLSVNGKFLSDISQVDKAVTDVIALTHKADGMMSQMSQRVQAVRDKYVPQLQAAIKADDHDEVEKLGRKAVEEFRSIERPILSLVGSSYITGVTIVKEEPPKHHGDYPRGHQYWLERREVPARAPEKIKALTSADVQHAVKIIHRLLDLTKEKIYWHSWLDFSGGDDFSEEIQDFNESVYMDFYDVWDYQSVDQVFTSALPHVDVYGQEVVVALLHWMDRSIKGEAK